MTKQRCCWDTKGSVGEHFIYLIHLVMKRAEVMVLCDTLFVICYTLKNLIFLLLMKMGVVWC